MNKGYGNCFDGWSDSCDSLVLVDRPQPSARPLFGDLRDFGVDHAGTPRGAGKIRRHRIVHATDMGGTAVRLESLAAQTGLAGSSAAGVDDDWHCLHWMDNSVIWHQHCLI